MDMVDELLVSALRLREACKLADAPPAEWTVDGIADTVGHAFNVRFRRVAHEARTAAGWRPSVRAYAVQDASGRRLGFVYMDFWGLVERPGAGLICPGHVYVDMKLPPASPGQGRRLDLPLARTVAQELGHAVHMLCHGSCVADYDDLPVDIYDLPSTLPEMVTLSEHASEGSAPGEAMLRCHFLRPFANYLQDTQVAVGLHSEGFDPHAATGEDLRQAAVGLWQGLSPVVAHPAFTPLGHGAGLSLAEGPKRFGDLLCYLHADAILHSGGGAAPRRRDAWSSPASAARVREELLDRAFPGERLAGLLAQREAVPHPLLPPALDIVGMLERRFGLRA